MSRRGGRLRLIGLVLGLVAADAAQATAHASQAFSSQGAQEIAFVSDRSGNDEIYLVSATGGRPRNLTRHPAQDSGPAWSPDGSQMVFASTRNGSWDLFVLSLAGGSVRQLTSDRGAEVDPNWAPATQRVL